jgi:hypothetical protein
LESGVESRRAPIATIKRVAEAGATDARRWLHVIRDLQQAVRMDVRWKEMQARRKDGGIVVLIGPDVH